MQPFNLIDFIEESNRIEGIYKTTEEEVWEYTRFLAHLLSIESLEKFVSVIQPGAKLRNKIGMNVYIGNYTPKKGGNMVEYELKEILFTFNLSPWEEHCRYEDLHPFMDGNGRSGRALWLKRMGGIEKAPLGFLHTFYYQTLQERRKENDY
jgi:hypothetical protein